MSLPYHIGNGWFGGLLPTTAFAMVAATGDIYYGLWYPVIVAAMTFVIGMLFIRETKDVDIYLQRTKSCGSTSLHSCCLPRSRLAADEGRRRLIDLRVRSTKCRHPVQRKANKQRCTDREEKGRDFPAFFAPSPDAAGGGWRNCTPSAGERNLEAQPYADQLNYVARHQIPVACGASPLT